MSVDDETIIPHIINALQNESLAVKMATKCNLHGAESLIVDKFNGLIQQGSFYEAAKIAATSPKVCPSSTQSRPFILLHVCEGGVAWSCID